MTSSPGSTSIGLTGAGYHHLPRRFPRHQAGDARGERSKPRNPKRKRPAGSGEPLTEPKWKFGAVMIRGCGSTWNLANSARRGDLQICKLRLSRVPLIQENQLLSATCSEYRAPKHRLSNKRDDPPASGMARAAVQRNVGGVAMRPAYMSVCAVEVPRRTKAPGPVRAWQAAQAACGRRILSTKACLAGPASGLSVVSRPSSSVRSSRAADDLQE